MAIFDQVWAHSGTVEAPDSQRVATGFTCGGVRPGLMNWIIQTLQQAVNNIGDLGAMVPVTRQINTTEGIQGGGTLENDRTLRFNFPGLDSVPNIQQTDLIAIYRGNKHYKITRQAFVAGLGGEGGSIILGGTNIGGAAGEVFSDVQDDLMRFRTLGASTAGIVIATTGDVVSIGFGDFEELTVN